MIGHNYKIKRITEYSIYINYNRRKTKLMTSQLVNNGEDVLMM